ncbi:MAG: TonB-dependent receptor, partial [Bacteroidota bacterium]
WQPMGTLYWLPSSRWRWQMSYRKQAQSPPLGLLAEVDEEGNALNPDLSWIQAHLVSGGFQSQLGKRWILETELYQQWLRDVPVEMVSSAFSAVNMVQTYRTELSPLMSAGESENRGLEVNLRTRSFEGWYTNLSGTLYQSVYRGSDNIERSTAFDGRFLGHVTVGRSFRFSKHPNRTLEGHISSLFRGGLRYRAIDQDASREQGLTVFVEGGLTEQLPAYFRVDARLIYRWEKPNRTSSLFLDIQNASNQQNTAFFYYDPEQDVILEQRQLGLIPILSYRLSW